MFSNLYLRLQFESQTWAYNIGWVPPDNREFGCNHDNSRILNICILPYSSYDSASHQPLQHEIEEPRTLTHIYIYTYINECVPTSTFPTCNHHHIYIYIHRTMHCHIDIRNMQPQSYSTMHCHMAIRNMPPLTSDRSTTLHLQRNRSTDNSIRGTSHSCCMHPELPEMKICRSHSCCQIETCGLSLHGLAMHACISACSWWTASMSSQRRRQRLSHFIHICIH